MFVYARAFIYRVCRNCVGIVNLIMPRGITVFDGKLLIASEGNDRKGFGNERYREQEARHLSGTVL